MRNPVPTMKNKTKQQMQLELIEKLLGSVNSSEEFSYLKAEEIQLLSFHPYTIRRRCSK